MALGLNVDEPETACDDQHCPFHGSLSVRGATLVGRVASTDMEKTAVVEREYDVFVPKYDRYMKRRSRVPAHAPPCLSLAVGDTVRIAETRPLSKTKSHVVIERLGRAGEHVAETAHVTPATERAADRAGDVGDAATDEGGDAAADVEGGETPADVEADNVGADDGGNDDGGDDERGDDDGADDEGGEA